MVFPLYRSNPVKFVSAVLMKPMDPQAPAALRLQYQSPVGSRNFDRLQLLDSATVAIKVDGPRYRLTATVPLAAIGLTPKPGLVLRGDAGIISSDAAGLTNVARTYWSNKATNLVNDLPSEAWLYPETWGELVFE